MNLFYLNLNRLLHQKDIPYPSAWRTNVGLIDLLFMPILRLESFLMDQILESYDDVHLQIHFEYLYGWKFSFSIKWKDIHLTHLPCNGEPVQTWGQLPNFTTEELEILYIEFDIDMNTILSLTTSQSSKNINIFYSFLSILNYINLLCLIFQQCMCFFQVVRINTLGEGKSTPFRMNFSKQWWNYS